MQWIKQAKFSMLKSKMENETIKQFFFGVWLQFWKIFEKLFRFNCGPYKTEIRYD